MVNMYDAAETPRVVNVQRGETLMSQSNTTNAGNSIYYKDITISAVNLSKTIVTTNYVLNDTSSVTSRGYLTSTTNLRVYANPVNPDATASILSYEVVEFG